MFKWFLFVLLVLFIDTTNLSLIKDKQLIQQFLDNVAKETLERNQKLTMDNWNYETDISDKTSKERLKGNKDFNDFRKRISRETKDYDWTTFDENTRQQFESLAFIGTSVLTGDKEKEYLRVTDEMETIYSSAKVCVSGNCGLALEPDLSNILANSRNYSQLLETWINWREASGAEVRDQWIRYYTLGNEAIKENPGNELKTLDQLWLQSWDSSDIPQQCLSMLEELKPFYRKLHAYVRLQLKKEFPKKMPKDKTLPAHLLGNMWAQVWNLDTIDPFPDIPTLDVTEALQKQKYSSRRMFELAEKFFVGLGMDPMTEDFWKYSVIEKPKDKEMVCHASAWDFLKKTDFRIKQCTSATHEFLTTIHHEMGHIQYYMLYRDQPTDFRNGANPGFHEAVGDLMTLSVNTPKHLKKINLLELKDSLDEKKVNLKFQFKMALQKLPVIFWAYVVDRFRWDVFSGNVSSADLNRHWWKLRGEIQGVSPPVKRSEADFDPGAKYHVIADVPYIRYFVSTVLQFQFHKALCAFGQKNVKLFQCDIDGDLKAGTLLMSVLSKGSSEKWPKLLKELTGSEKMSVQPMIEYFEPLNEFLDKELKKVKKKWSFDGLK